MLKRNSWLHFAAALAFGVVMAIAGTAHAAESTSKDLEATGKAMAEQLGAIGIGMTPEKEQAMKAAMAKHMAGITPEMEAAGKTVAQSVNSPEMRESMDKVAKDMSGMMAKQVPVMMQAMQPMLADMLPRMLRMQADMLQIMFAPPAKPVANKKAE